MTDGRMDRQMDRVREDSFSKLSFPKSDQQNPCQITQKVEKKLKMMRITGFI